MNVTITGIDKYKVGQFAAEIREWRKPEPYKVGAVNRRPNALRSSSRRQPACKLALILCNAAIVLCVCMLQVDFISFRRRLRSQGKGIRYLGEEIKLKEGKKGK